MAEEKRYFWLKLNQDFFDSKRIKKLRRMAGGDTYTIIYLKMQLLALNNDGIITWTGLEENIADELALDLDEAADDIKVTLTYMLHCGLCETSDNVNFFLPYVVQNTGSEGSSAKRKREQRAREKALAREKCDNVTQLSAQCPQMSAQRHGEKDKDKEEEEDIEQERKYAGARAREEKPVDNFFDVENSDEEDELSTSPFIFDPSEEDEEEEDETEEADGRADKGEELHFLGGEIGQGVLLISDNQMSELLDCMGMQAFNEYARRVSDYIIRKDAKITSCAATIKKWWLEDLQKGKRAKP